MKPAWDQLAGEYDGHASVTVGDVDCTVSRAQRHSLHKSSGLSAGALAGGQVERDLCQNEGVRGYPTIKYWKGGAESKYQVNTRPSSHSSRSRLRFLSFSGSPCCSSPKY